MTLCATVVLPLDLSMSLGVGFSFLYIVASCLMGLTVWLTVREVRKKSKVLKRAAVEEAWGNKSLKEKIQVVKNESGYDQQVMRIDTQGFRI